MTEPPLKPVKYVETTVHLPYHYVAGDSRARYLRALKDRNILGSRCSKTGKVFVPPLDPYYQAAIGLDPVSTAALQASAYMARAGGTDRDLAAVAARNRAAGARNPDNQLREAAPADALQRTPWAVEPLRTGYLPPVGESASCLILAAEGKAERLCDRPAWIHGVDHRTEMQTLGARDLTRSASTRLAAEKALAMAGIGSAAEVDVVGSSPPPPSRS